MFRPAITDSGICCAFNLKTDLKDSMYKMMVDEMKVKKTRPDQILNLKQFKISSHISKLYLLFIREKQRKTMLRRSLQGRIMAWRLWWTDTQTGKKIMQEQKTKIKTTFKNFSQTLFVKTFNNHQDQSCWSL